MSFVKCSVCEETGTAVGSVVCRCGKIVCHYCHDNSEYLLDKACSFSNTCKKDVVKVCAGCEQDPLCDTHMWLNAYSCSHCGSFACEECFVEDFAPNNKCKSRRGCIACGACEMWNSKNNPRQMCRNCLQCPDEGCIACGGRNVPQRESCNNCFEDRKRRYQLLSMKKTTEQAKFQTHCGYHIQNQVLCLPNEHKSESNEFYCSQKDSSKILEQEQEKACCATVETPPMLDLMPSATKKLKSH